MEEVVFDLEPAIVHYKIGGKRCLLREASGDVAVKYRNTSLKAHKLNAEGKLASLDGIADVEPYTVSLCLYWADDEGRLRCNNDGSPNPAYLVPLMLLRSWPSRVQKQLFARLKEISDLEERPETVEQLEKRIREDSKKLQDLQAARDGQEQAGEPAKNALAAVVTSASSA